MLNETQQTTPKPETPEWAYTTPDDKLDFRLVVTDRDGTYQQAVETTREEFIELKRHLVALRGIPVPKAE